MTWAMTGAMTGAMTATTIADSPETHPKNCPNCSGERVILRKGGCFCFYCGTRANGNLQLSPNCSMSQHYNNQQYNLQRNGSQDFLNSLYGYKNQFDAQCDARYPFRLPRNMIVKEVP